LPVGERGKSAQRLGKVCGDKARKAGCCCSLWGWVEAGGDPESREGFIAPFARPQSAFLGILFIYTIVYFSTCARTLSLLVMWSASRFVKKGERARGKIEAQPLSWLQTRSLSLERYTLFCALFHRRGVRTGAVRQTLENGCVPLGSVWG